MRPWYHVICLKIEIYSHFFSIFGSIFFIFCRSSVVSKGLSQKIQVERGQTLKITLVITSLFQYFLKFWQNQLTDENRFHILFIFLVAAMFAISVSVLFFYHLYLTLTNRTTLGKLSHCPFDPLCKVSDTQICQIDPLSRKRRNGFSQICNR